MGQMDEIQTRSWKQEGLEAGDGPRPGAEEQQAWLK
jgi:hypothetical protein